jgi:hypothetical protein
MGNGCYISVQNPLFSHVLPKNIKIRIYGSIILPVVLYRFETRFLTLREGYRLRVYETRVLRSIYGSKGMKRWEIGENCIMSSVI